MTQQSPERGIVVLFIFDMGFVLFTEQDIHPGV